jgi:hypothetical protein
VAPSPNSIDSITLQVVAGTGLLSDAIAWWGNGYHGFSHVDAVMKDGSLIGARDDWITPLGVPNARPILPGIQRRPPFYEKWKRRATLTFLCTSKIAQEWAAWQEQGIGLPYDEDAILGMVFGRRWHAEGHWICSARQIDGLQTFGFIHRLRTPSQQITPDTVFNIGCAVGAITRLYPSG